MLVKFRYVHRDVDRHGNVRLYFQRKGGPKIRLREEPGSEAFSKAYHALLSPTSTARAVPAEGATPHQPTAGTYRWLCVEYFKSAAFRRLEKSTQVTRRRVLEHTCLEPVHAGAKETFAAFPLWRLTTRALRILRDRKADLPGAASDRVKAIRAAFKWACEEDLIDTNPALALAKLPLTGGGFHSWTTEEVARFEARHALGSKARLALALLLWTGVRRSDLVGLGRQHARAGWLEFTQAKNRNRRPVRIEIPILPQLQEVLEASPTGDLTYLVTEAGRPFSVAGFGNWFRARCNEAGLRALLRPRPAQSRRGDGCRERRNHATADGHLRLAEPGGGGTLHAGRRAQAPGRRRHAHLSQKRPIATPQRPPASPVQAQPRHPLATIAAPNPEQNLPTPHPVRKPTPKTHDKSTPPPPPGAPDRMKLRTPMSLKSHSDSIGDLERARRCRFRRFKSGARFDRDLKCKC